VVPRFNEQTGEAIAQFGGRQEQILFTGNGNPVAAGSDPICQQPDTCPPADGFKDAGTTPLILIFTVDIDSNAPGGLVDVLLGLQTFDDTAINIATNDPVAAQQAAIGSGANPCRVFFVTNGVFLGNTGKPIAAGVCGSNFLNIGPEIYSFTVEGPEHPSTPTNLQAFDTNDSCFLDDPEFFAMIDGWVASLIGDTLFFSGVDAWVGQDNICAATAGSGVSTLSLSSVALETNSFGTTTFVVTGQGIESMGVEVFSLNGNAVFSQKVAGTQLSWNQATNKSAPLANGTYLYVVTVKNADGNVVKSEVKKLVILR